MSHSSPLPTITLPGCKSSSQRALMLASLAAGESELHGLSTGRDSVELMAALEACGHGLEWQADGSLRLQGSDGPQAVTAKALDLGEGASTLRFLAPRLVAAPCALTLDLAPALARRPHAELLDLLRRLGATVELAGRQWRLRAEGWAGEELEVPTSHSSQLLSGLLMAAGRHPMRFHLPGPLVSAPYLDLTVAMLRAARGKDILACAAGEWRQRAGFGRGRRWHLPADPSAMVFFAVAALLIQRPLRLARPWTAPHPDQQVLTMLEAAELLEIRGTECHPHPLDTAAPLSFDLGQAPDSGPALAVLAAALPHGMRFLHPQRLRGKESDRLDGMRRLAALGGAGAELQADGSLWVAPAACFGASPSPPEAPFRTASDHRLAMAAGLAGLVWETPELDDPTVVAKSFPNFWEELAHLDGSRLPRP